MEKTRILIADDHAIVRRGIRLLLESQPDMEVVGEARDGRDGLEQAQELNPDVMLMDITMPGMDGIEASRVIKASCPKVKILALTMHDNASYFFQMLQAGASGYVVKGAEPAELLSAIRAVRQNGVYLYPSLARELLDGYLEWLGAGEGRDSYARLTTREKEVFKLIVEGYTAREIAKALFLSPNTVERHRSNIMDKLGMHRKSQLIRFAISKGLVKPED